MTTTQNRNPSTDGKHHKKEIISSWEVTEYQEKGFIVVDNIFNQEEIELMNSAISELIAGAQGLEESNLIYDLGAGHEPKKPQIRRIKDPFLHHEIFSKMARNPRLISCLNSLLGPNIRLHGSKINLKPAHDGSSVEWHQDWAFYPHTNDNVLAVGVMLDDMTPENGPLLMMPGSHKGPTHDHHQDGRFVGAINHSAVDIPFERAEALFGKCGACSFHHARTIHGSAINKSDKNRRLLLFQIAAADAWDLTGPEKLDWEAYLSTILSGSPSIESRLELVPIRLPYPPAERQGSIYENQSLLKNKFF